MFERRYSLAKFSVNLETKTIEIAETFSEALNSVAGVAIPVDVRERYADAVQGYTRGTISVVSTMSTTEALSSAVKMSANIVARFTAAERLAAEVVLMQVTIPPGGELRLDSDVFLAMLDGENVLYAQSGDWINVSRELLRLIVESATGGDLEGQIIYTERYL